MEKVNLIEKVNLEEILTEKLIVNAGMDFSRLSNKTVTRVKSNGNALDAYIDKQDNSTVLRHFVTALIMHKGKAVISIGKTKHIKGAEFFESCLTSYINNISVGVDSWHEEPQLTICDDKSCVLLINLTAIKDLREITTDYKNGQDTVISRRFTYRGNEYDIKLI